jgi:FkbM family methyltransferase
MLFNLIELHRKYDLQISGVIHIGAHYGEENNVYDELKIEHRVFFEPVTANFNILSQKIKYFPLYKLALGNSECEIKMYLESSNQGQSCSILGPRKHLEQYPHIVFEGQEIVSMVRLDDFLPNIERYNFINIDVQGYELEVFKGSVKILESITYIMSEINRDELYEKCAKVHELDGFLSRFNFKRVETFWGGGTWGDAFYIKNCDKEVS